MTRTMKIHLKYLVMAAVIGGLWFQNRHRPAWEEGIRVLIVFALVMLLMKRLVARRGITIELGPALLTKTVLIAIALAVQLLVGRWTSDPAGYVAVGLALIIALLGPLFDHRFFSYTPTPSPTQEVHP